MDRRDKHDAIQRYAERIINFGPTVQALGWRDKEQQELRFSVLADIGDLDGKSILDVGCGFGDLYGFLRNAGVSTQYTGIDISPDVLTEAKKRYKGIRFEQLDLLDGVFTEQFDYVIGSGIFNHRMNNNEQFVRAMLTQMYKQCTIGIATNMMTSFVDYQEDYLYYYDPALILTFSKSLSRFICLIHNYPLYEFSVFIYKKNIVPT